MDSTEEETPQEESIQEEVKVKEENKDQLENRTINTLTLLREDFGQLKEEVLKVFKDKDGGAEPETENPAPVSTLRLLRDDLSQFKEDVSSIFTSTADPKARTTRPLSLFREDFSNVFRFSRNKDRDKIKNLPASERAEDVFRKLFRRDQTPVETKEDKQETKKDRKETKEDRREIKEDKQKTKEDRQEIKEELSEDKQETKEDSQETKEDRQEIKEDRQEIKEELSEDKHETKEDSQETKEDRQEIKEDRQEMKEKLSEDKQKTKEDSQETKEDRQEIKEDRQEVKEDRQENKEDSQETKEDSQETKEDRQEIKEDRQEVKEDRQEIKEDRQENKEDRQETKKTLSEDRQEQTNDGSRIKLSENEDTFDEQEGSIVENEPEREDESDTTSVSETTGSEETICPSDRDDQICDDRETSEDEEKEVKEEEKKKEESPEKLQWENLVSELSVFSLRENTRDQLGGRVAAELWLVKNFACYLTFDPSTANSELQLSEGNRKATRVWSESRYQEHQDRFLHCPQVLCREGLLDSVYWEVEWSGGADVGVAYNNISRDGDVSSCLLGHNPKSWSLECSEGSYTPSHNNRRFRSSKPRPFSRRVGLHLDWAAGSLSFYCVSRDAMVHLHTFTSSFTEPLYPGFWVWAYNGAVTLRQVELDWERLLQ